MISSFGISLSGLTAARARFEAAARNIAGARSAGVPAGSGTESATRQGAYRPVRVHQTAEPGGGTRAVVVPVEPATVAVFDPHNAGAGEDGTVQNPKVSLDPNVSLASEFVDAKVATLAYKANLATWRTADEMLGELMDSIS